MGKARSGGIPRPQNAFFIFRNYLSAIRKKSSAERHCQQDVSRDAASLWAGLTEDEKQKYRDAAAEEKQQHKLKYPHYVYRPQRTVNGSRRHFATKEERFPTTNDDGKHGRDQNDTALPCPVTLPPFRTPTMPASSQSHAFPSRPPLSEPLHYSRDTLNSSSSFLPIARSNDHFDDTTYIFQPTGSSSYDIAQQTAITTPNVPYICPAPSLVSRELGSTLPISYAAEKIGPLDGSIGGAEVIDPIDYRDRRQEDILDYPTIPGNEDTLSYSGGVIWPSVMTSPINTTITSTESVSSPSDSNSTSYESPMLETPPPPSSSDLFPSPPGSERRALQAPLPFSSQSYIPFHRYVDPDNIAGYERSGLGSSRDVGDTAFANDRHQSSRIEYLHNSVPPLPDTVQEMPFSSYLQSKDGPSVWNHADTEVAHLPIPSQCLQSDPFSDPSYVGQVLSSPVDDEHAAWPDSMYFGVEADVISILGGTGYNLDTPESLLSYSV